MATPTPSDWLLLVPTRFELNLLGLEDLNPRIAGFGPIAAAASTAAAIARYAPRRVMLVGIAGSFDPVQFPLASARSFDACVIDQLGIGQGPAHITAETAGFPQLETDPPLFNRARLAGSPGLLVTTACASATPSDAAARQARHPGALAEDMEAFGAALACHLAGLALTVIRGASNIAGQRDKAQWQIPAALTAAAAAVRSLIESRP